MIAKQSFLIEPYDHRTELCCGDGPVKFTKSSDKCCGTRLYNSEYQGCCGNQPFNTSTHECCLPSKLSYCNRSLLQSMSLFS